MIALESSILITALFASFHIHKDGAERLGDGAEEKTNLRYTKMAN